MEQQPREYLIPREVVTVDGLEVVEMVSSIKYDSEQGGVIIERAGKSYKLDFELMNIATDWLHKKDRIQDIDDVKLKYAETRGQRNERLWLIYNNDSLSKKRAGITEVLSEEIVATVREAIEPPKEEAGQEHLIDFDETRQILALEINGENYFDVSYRLNMLIGNCKLGDIPDDILEKLIDLYGQPSMVNGRIVTKENRAGLRYCPFTEEQHKPRLMIKGVGWNEVEWVSGLADGFVAGVEGGIILPRVFLAPERRLLRLIRTVYSLQKSGIEIDEVDIPVMNVSIIRPVEQDRDLMRQRLKGFLTKK